jgi:hypothetical protein
LQLVYGKTYKEYGESLDDAANQAKIAEKQQKIEAMTPEQVETFYTKIQGVP